MNGVAVGKKLKSICMHPEELDTQMR